MSQPNNTDILVEINKNHAEVVTRLSAVEEQVKITNGQVKENSQWISNRNAVEEYKMKNPVQVSKAENVNIRSVWFSEGGQKVFLAVAGVIGSLGLLIAAYATVVSINGGG